MTAPTGTEATTARIVEVLGEHAGRPAAYGSVRCKSEECGYFGSWREHFAHVAELLSAEFGPTEPVKKPRRLHLGRLSIYLEPRDVWVGVFVGPDAVYVCPLPLLVFRWTSVLPPEGGNS